MTFNFAMSFEAAPVVTSTMRNRGGSMFNARQEAWRFTGSDPTLNKATIRSPDFSSRRHGDPHPDVFKWSGQEFGGVTLPRALV